MGAVFKFAFTVSLLFFVDVCRSVSLEKAKENGKLVFSKTVDLPAIPSEIRYKSVYYKGKDTIKGVEVIDLADSSSAVRVYSGGVGYTFIKMSLQSQPGKPLKYQVKVFV